MDGGERITSQEQAERIWAIIDEFRAKLDGKTEDPEINAESEKFEIQTRVTELCYTMLDDICDLYEDIHEGWGWDTDKIETLERIVSAYCQIFGGFNEHRNA